jgi:hypothetical protein
VFPCAMCNTTNSWTAMTGGDGLHSIHSGIPTELSILRYYPVSDPDLARVTGVERTMRDVCKHFPTMTCRHLLERRPVTIQPDMGYFLWTSSTEDVAEAREDPPSASSPRHSSSLGRLSSLSLSLSMCDRSVYASRLCSMWSSVHLYASRLHSM